jgi:UDP-glucuronate 4-epimerase
MSPPILVTGAAGFVGHHVAARLLRDGRRVVGLDSFTPYYDRALKEARFSLLLAEPGFHGVRQDLTRSDELRELFGRWGFERVVHLAAQPGVRYALDHPETYVSSNLTGFANLLEACRGGGVAHLVFASSSSVYGANRKLPFAEGDAVDHPISLYAATKRANELMAHAYAHLFQVPMTGLRFFTVYGPWGRPDMAVYIFTDRIAKGLPIEVAAAGQVRRDFTFVDDIVEGLVRVLDRPAQRAPESGGAAGPARSVDAPFRIFNIGGARPESLDRVIALIERALGRQAIRVSVPLPPGDVAETSADTTDLERELGFLPITPLEVGIERFVTWYRDYHRG